MQATDTVAGPPLNLRVGQLVEVRSAAEIQATLDENGELDALPFMPEMLQYCGRQLTVASVANKLCDTMTRSGMRKMRSAVHLTDARCDGGGHGGCEAACLIYWKEAWLTPVTDPAGPAPTPAPALPPAAAPDQARLLPLLVTNSRRPPAADGAEVYKCQATELLRAAPEPLPLLNAGQYVDDIRTGNVGTAKVVRAFSVGLFNRVQGVSQRLPAPLRFHDGLPWKFLKGTADKTPTGFTDLKPGELVKIKSIEEIEATLNADLLNRGMGFDAEMARFCGRTARVARRVNHIIEETSGKMLDMKNPCIVLEGIVCEGAYNANCPRAIPAYWREIWLDRVEETV